jgi:hypothetical protein
MRPLWTALLLAACVDPDVGDRSQDVTEVVYVDAGTGPDAPTLGMCGANLDPVIGARCTYQYSGPTGPAEWVSYQILPGGESTSDRVVCTWRIPCQGALSARTSPEGALCSEVIGTGCPPPWPRTVQLSRTFLLPDGLTNSQVAAFCQSNPPTLSYAADACSSLHDTIELNEDYCCVRRPINEFLDTFGLHPWATPRP